MLQQLRHRPRHSRAQGGTRSTSVQVRQQVDAERLDAARLEPGCAEGDQARRTRTGVVPLTRRNEPRPIAANSSPLWSGRGLRVRSRTARHARPVRSGPPLQHDAARLAAVQRSRHPRRSNEPATAITNGPRPRPDDAETRECLAPGARLTISTGASLRRELLHLRSRRSRISRLGGRPARSATAGWPARLCRRRPPCSSAPRTVRSSFGERQRLLDVVERAEPGRLGPRSRRCRGRTSSPRRAHCRGLCCHCGNRLMPSVSGIQMSRAAPGRAPRGGSQTRRRFPATSTT